MRGKPLNRSFDCEEQTTNVDSVECGDIGQCSLVTEEDNSRSRCRNDWVDSLAVEKISLCLRWVVCKFDRVVYNTARSTCKSENHGKEFCEVLAIIPATSVTWNVTELVSETIEGVLITTIKNLHRKRNLPDPSS